MKPLATLPIIVPSVLQLFKRLGVSKNPAGFQSISLLSTFVDVNSLAELEVPIDSSLKFHGHI